MYTQLHVSVTGYILCLHVHQINIIANKTYVFVKHKSSWRQIAQNWQFLVHV